MIPIVATIVSATFFVASAVAFAASAILQRRAARTYTDARYVYDRAKVALEAAEQSHAAGVAARDEARRIHAHCRTIPMIEAQLIGPLGLVRVGRA